MRELTGGYGADVIFDPVGGEPSDQAVQGIAWGGRLVLIGISAGFPKLNPLDMIGRTYSAIGAAIHHRTEAEREKAIADLDRLVSRDRIIVPIEGQSAFAKTPTMIASIGADIIGRAIFHKQ